MLASDENILYQFNSGYAELRCQDGCLSFGRIGHMMPDHSSRQGSLLIIWDELYHSGPYDTLVIPWKQVPAPPVFSTVLYVYQLFTSPTGAAYLPIRPWDGNYPQLLFYQEAGVPDYAPEALRFPKKG